MKSNPMKEGALTENSSGIGTATQMVRESAVELAIVNGRSEHDQMREASRKQES
jgi:hypothetical protein